MAPNPYSELDGTKKKSKIYEFVTVHMDTPQNCCKKIILVAGISVILLCFLCCLPVWNVEKSKEWNKHRNSVVAVTNNGKELLKYELNERLTVKALQNDDYQALVPALMGMKDFRGDGLTSQMRGFQVDFNVPHEVHSAIPSDIATASKQDIVNFLGRTLNTYAIPYVQNHIKKLNPKIKYNNTYAKEYKKFPKARDFLSEVISKGKHLPMVFKQENVTDSKEKKLMLGQSLDAFQNYAEFGLKNMATIRKGFFGIRVPYAKPWIQEENLIFPQPLLCDNANVTLKCNVYIFGHQFTTINHLPKTEVNHTLICILHGTLKTIFFPANEVKPKEVFVQTDECLYIPPNIRYKQFNTGEQKALSYTRYIFNMGPKFNATKCPLNEHNWDILPRYNKIAPQKSERILLEATNFMSRFEDFYE